MCKYRFFRDPGREKINDSMPGTHFGKTKPPKLNKHCGLHSLLLSACCHGFYFRHTANNEPPPQTEARCELPAQKYSL